jgi:hypothetical protein
LRKSFRQPRYFGSRPLGKEKIRILGDIGFDFNEMNTESLSPSPFTAGSKQSGDDKKSKPLLQCVDQDGITSKSPKSKGESLVPYCSFSSPKEMKNSLVVTIFPFIEEHNVKVLSKFKAGERDMIGFDGYLNVKGD